MTAEERIIQLEAENAALRAEVVARQEQMEQLMERLKAQEDQRAKDSHKSTNHLPVTAQPANGTPEHTRSKKR